MTLFERLRDIAAYEQANPGSTFHGTEEVLSNSLPAVLNLIEAAQRSVSLHEDVVHAIEAREALERAVAVFVTPEGDRSTMSGQEEQP